MIASDRSATAPRFGGAELLGKTLGVVGLGAIGSRLVELCAPFGMTVLVFDPYCRRREPPSAGVHWWTLAELLERVGLRSGDAAR